MMPLEQCRPLNGGRVRAAGFVPVAIFWTPARFDGSRGAGTTFLGANRRQIRPLATAGSAQLCPLRPWLCKAFTVRPLRLTSFFTPYRCCGSR